MKENTKKLRPKEVSEDTKKDTFSNEMLQEEVNAEYSEESQGIEIDVIFPTDLTEDLMQNPKEFYETTELRILTTQVLEHLASTTIDYCFLSGGFSVGKSTVVENVVQKVNNKEVSDFFWDYYFLQFEARDFVNLEPELFFNSISVAAAELYEEGIDDVIIFIKHANYLSSEIFENFHRVCDTICENCKTLNLKFIFSVHYTFCETLQNYAFLSRTVIKTVTMPKFEDVSKILLPKIQELESLHNCTIPQKVLKFLITLVMANQKDDLGLSTYIFFCDLVLTKVELAKRNEVTMEDIYQNFEQSFADWKSFDETERVRIAYHEAGHTVLGLVALDKYYKLLAVTSIPSIELSSLGATIEHFKTHLYNVDKKLLKKFCAFYLAGRESEMLAGYKANNGALSDLSHMSTMLRETISKTGLFKNVSTNYSYDLENFVSEQATTEIDNEAKKFSEKSAKYARKVLKKNWKLVEMIANRLITEGLIPGSDVEKMYKKYLKKNKKK